MNNSKKKKTLLIACIIVVIMISFIAFFVYRSHEFSKKNNKTLNIEEVLKDPNYSYLPEAAKEYIREIYEETGEILLTEKNKEEDSAYLNPAYVEYLKNKSATASAPSSVIVDYNENAAPKASTNLPSKYDLRNVDGKNYVTPFEDQGDEGLCWDYSANSQLASLVLKTNNESYSSNSVIFSKQQLDYATAGATTYGRIPFNRYWCSRNVLSSGANFNCFVTALLDGMGAVSKTWDSAHADAIKHDKNNPKKPIDATDIYNFDNSLYEVNSAVDFPALDFTKASSDTATKYINDLKTYLVNYGGLWLNTDMGYGYLNTYNGKKMIVINRAPGAVNFLGSLPHAMHIIGWDDDFEYTSCKNHMGQEVDPKECDAGTTIKGKGVWIAKNSWATPTNGNTDTSTVLIGYQSDKSEYNVVTGISKKTWDNYYQLKSDESYTTTNVYTFKKENVVSNEKLDKIKMYLKQNTNYKIYISPNGNSDYTLIQEFQKSYPGYYYVDMSSKDYTITDKTTFKVISGSSNNSIKDFRIYTDNLNNNIKIKTNDVYYNEDTAFFSNTKKYVFGIFSTTKNLKQNSKLTYKIKDSAGNYIDSKGYSYTYNSVYTNIVDAKLTIDSDYFSKGVYTIETYYNDVLYSTSKLNIELDLMQVSGNGTEQNPWQISTPDQFSFIRNMPFDSFVLKNDIDFGTATKNKDGSLYNDGYGFDAIPHFYGYLDGKGYSLKNLYSKSKLSDRDGNTEIKIGGIFDEVVISDIPSPEEQSDNECKLSKCGIANLKVVNPLIIGAHQTGGLVNRLVISANSPENDSSIIHDGTEFVTISERIKFENISVIGGKITNLESPSYNIGGIVGHLLSHDTFVYGGASFNNLFNSATIVSATSGEVDTELYYVDEMLGGIIGGYGTWTQNEDTLAFNNIMNMGTIKTGLSTVRASNLLNIEFYSPGNIAINNAILINNPSLKAIDSVMSKEELQETKFKIDNLYTDANDTISSNITAEQNNVLKKQTVYEIANANYSNWNNFSTNWLWYNKDGVKRIPVLKSASLEYLNIKNEIPVGVSQEVDLLDIVTSPKDKTSVKVLSSCSYNLDVCKNQTDTEIIQVHGTKIKALKNGETNVIVTNSTDGYIGLVKVLVGDYQKVTFDANGGEGTMNTQLIEKDVNAKLVANTFTREGYRFIGWNTESDGTGDAYTDGQTIKISSDLKLYAMWEKKLVITFDANSGEGTMNLQLVEKNTDAKLNANTFTKKGYKFIGWNTKDDGTGKTYTDGQTIKITEDSILYAMWEAITYTIKFDANGGEGTMESVVVTYDKEYKLEANKFTKNHFFFKGWNTAKDRTGTSYKNGEIVKNLTTKDQDIVTLYAIWVKRSGMVIFHSNTENDQTIEQDFLWDTELKLKKNTFANEEYTFINWNTKKDGSGQSYSDEQIAVFKPTPVINANGITEKGGASLLTKIDLYAIWKEDYDFIVNTYSVDRENKTIDLIGIGTTLEEYKEKITLHPEFKMEVETKEVDGKKVLYTGSKTKIYKGDTLYIEFDNIVRGDTNGDAFVNIIDYIRIKKDIMKTKELDGIYKKAADIDMNDVVDAADYTKIKEMIMEDAR